MSISRFFKSFALTLVVPFLTYAVAPGTPPSSPFKFERFIVKTSDAIVPNARAETDSKAKESAPPEPASERIFVPRKADLSIPAQPLFTHSTRRLSLIDKTYLDAYAILQESNTCSQFFGGPRVATSVLNSLHPKLKKAQVTETQAGISMFGPITNYTDLETGLSYRIFERALINQAGPFFQSVNFQTQGYFHKIGNFPANTREARVSMLLHELGHLLPGPNGGWLLPDDGGSEALSITNTWKVMGHCREQIKRLSVETVPEGVSINRDDEKR